MTKNLLKSTNSIQNSDDFILCGDIKSEPLIFRENLHLVLKSLSKSHDGVNELIDKEIAHLIDEEISLAENCNFYTYQDIPKELVHNIIRNLDMFHFRRYDRVENEFQPIFLILKTSIRIFQ